MNIKLLPIAALLMLTLTSPAQQPVEIKLHDAQKGIVSMRNNFPARDLGDCRITWILLENGHKIEVVQINNLTAEPNATAYLEFPYASKPFVYGGERWIRIEIRDKDKTDDEILAWAQFPLPETTSPPPKPFKPELMPDISTSEDKTSIRFFNKIFSVSFSKSSGRITQLKFYDKPRLLKGPSLAMEPPLDALDDKLILIEHSATDKKETRVTTAHQYADKDGKAKFKHTADYHIYGDGTVTIDSTVNRLDEADQTAPSWIGFKMRLPDIVHIDWYGSRAEGPVEITKIDASDLSASPGKTTGPISDLRWLGLTGKFCRGTFWSSEDNYLTAEVSMKDKGKFDCLLGMKIEDPARNKDTIGFNIRVHRYDTVLGFPDKLWHLKIRDE